MMFSQISLTGHTTTFFKAFPAPAPTFTTAAQWGANVTTIITEFGFAISGAAFIGGFLMLMFAWGNERREGQAKTGIYCACIGFFGMLAVAGLKLIISQAAGAPIP